MTNFDVDYRFKQLSVEIKHLTRELKELKENADFNDLWDNSEMIRKWMVSTRTLADWRANSLIQYIKIGSKIYYTKEMRDEFLIKNTKIGGGQK